jgi:hypothetical protein
VATLPWPAQTCGSGEQTTLARWEGVSGLAARLYTPLYTLRPKIFALVDFCDSLLTIRLIRKNCENVIYYLMTYFIIVYILSIS